jgi:outer membrane protein OmpA-like peptidoglycan-associated protein
MVASYTGVEQIPPEETPVPPAAVAAEAPVPPAAVTAEAPVPPAAVAAEAPEETSVPPAAVAAEAPVPPAAIAAEAPEETSVPPAAVAAEAPPVERVGAVILDNIYFRSNSTVLTETEKAKLRNMAAVLSRYPNGKILIGGHTVMSGSENGRRQISRERAQAVADFLISQTGRPREGIIVHGYGARRPLSTARQDAAVNRRVEITLLNEDYYRIQYMPDSAVLPETEKGKLWELAAVLSRYPDVDLLVTGYTALTGNEAGRERISTARARAAANFLRSSGFRSGTITVRGYGARQLGDNATAEGKALNRQVEIAVLDGAAK